MNRSVRLFATLVVASLGAAAHAAEITDDPEALLGRPADVAPSAYEYRADRSPDQNPPDTEADRNKLTDVAVRRGDALALVVGHKGNHFCDSTVVELVISEGSRPSRTWDLAKDVVGSLHAGNPHADSLGNPGVWSFYTTQGSVPAPHDPPLTMSSQAASAREFVRELATKKLATIRQRVRLSPEQTWEQAVQAMHPGTALPPHPRPPSDPVMQIDVPCQRLTAQWNLGT
jgi:hypothetical protein